jgi:uncharacterized protein YjiS (DUF1127 family)
MNSETTYDPYKHETDQQAGEAVSRGPVPAIKRVAHRITKSLLRAHWERETIRELAKLHPDMLRDIGMRQDDIREVAGDLAKERADAWARHAQASNGFGG